MAYSSTTTRKPVLALVSHTLRRDLEEPLRHFTHLAIVHLYHDASYRDMSQADFASQPIRYVDSKDLGRRLGELKPDIIQGPEPYASRLALRNAWVVYRYAKATGTPYFFPMFENRPPRIKFGLLIGSIMTWLLGWYAARAAGVITLNQGARESLLAAGVPASKLTRLSWGTWGIDTKEFAPDTKRQSERPMVLFVGRISAKKGIDDLLTAWDSILAAVPTARLVVGGPALDEDSQILLDRLQHTPAGEYVGPIKNTDLPRYFQSAWVTVAPSVTTKTWAEQVGMINLQSLACGTPVVTTRSGAIPEYVGSGNGAQCIDEHDVSGMSQAVIELLTDAQRREQLGRKGRTHVAKQYEVVQNVRRCEEYVLGLLARNKH